MRTVLCNALIVAWALALLLTPAAVLAARSALTALSLATCFAGSLVLVSATTVLVSLAGDGVQRPLAAVAVLLGLIMLAVAATRIRAGLSRGEAPRLAPRSRDVGGLLLATAALGLWHLLPSLKSMAIAGVPFGLARAGNNDVANYAIAAEQVARAGFLDSRHIANLDYGSFSQQRSYLAATALIDQVSAATGLAAWQVTLPVMAVAITLCTLCLAAFSESVWPQFRVAGYASACVACLVPLTSYNFSDFFLGAALGLAALALMLAGATGMGRDGPGARGAAAVAVGGALGVYAYAQLDLPALVLIPVWAVVAHVVTRRPAAGLLRTLGWSAAASGVGLLLALPGLPTAVTLIREQSTATAGWTLAPFSPLSALIMGGRFIVGPQEVVVGAKFVVGWVAVGLAAAALLRVAARRGHAASSACAAALVVPAALCALGTGKIYGPAAYQHWKLISYLLPLALVVVLPAVRALLTGTDAVQRRTGFVLVATATCVLAVTGPLLSWRDYLSDDSAYRTTTPDLAALTHSSTLGRLRSVNLLLTRYFETMAAAAMVRRPALVLATDTYAPVAMSDRTCTLTRRDLVKGRLPVGTVDVNATYVLVPVPAPCDWKRPS